MKLVRATTLVPAQDASTSRRLDACHARHHEVHENDIRPQAFRVARSAPSLSFRRARCPHTSPARPDAAAHEDISSTMTTPDPLILPPRHRAAVCHAFSPPGRHWRPRWSPRPACCGPSRGRGPPAAPSSSHSKCPASLPPGRSAPVVPRQPHLGAPEVEHNPRRPGAGMVVHIAEALRAMRYKATVTSGGSWRDPRTSRCTATRATPRSPPRAARAGCRATTRRAYATHLHEQRAHSASAPGEALDVLHVAPGLRGSRSPAAAHGFGFETGGEQRLRDRVVQVAGQPRALAGGGAFCPLLVAQARAFSIASATWPSNDAARGAGPGPGTALRAIGEGEHTVARCAPPAAVRRGARRPPASETATGRRLRCARWGRPAASRRARRHSAAPRRSRRATSSVSS